MTRTSYWPIADWASCGWLSSAGTELGVTDIGTWSRSPIPNLAACARKSSAPTCMPSHPKAVLQEISRAWVRVVLLFGAAGALEVVGQVGVGLGQVEHGGPGDHALLGELARTPGPRRR